MKSLCQAIGAPIKEEKVEGPTTCPIFLGIVLDTVSMEASISADRKTSLLTAIHSFRTLKNVQRDSYYLLLVSFPSPAKLSQLAVFFYEG